MHSVMLRSVEHPFQWPKGCDHFCVNPELVQEVELAVDEHVGGRQEQGQGVVEGLESNEVPQNLK